MSSRFSRAWRVIALFTSAMSFSNAIALNALDVDQPVGWDSDLRMKEPEDINPDPRIIEFNLNAYIEEIEFVAGKKTPAWTYNGTVPGPLIRARKGDRLIVHFTNHLPDPTTIHWHGLRLPNKMDGTPGISQPAIEPGESFVYDFILNDPGTYWYHPHFDSAAQVGYGLYGALIVEDPQDPKELGDDLVLIFSDMSIDADGGLQSPDIGGSFGDLFGREGGTLLVNGKVRPSLKVRKGKQQRWRVINAARSRYYRLSHRGHRWIRVGGDNGLMEHPETLPRVLVTPGERLDVVFTPSNSPGSRKAFRWMPIDRGYGTALGRSPVDMMYLETIDAEPVEPVDIPEQLRVIELIDITSAIEKTLDLNIFLGGGTRMAINQKIHDFVVEAVIGETHVWTIKNDTDFDHPFHLHGYFFQVLDENRVPEWKDTVNVPIKSEVKLAVKFDERPGTWMLHCHILDHAEVGMMGVLITHDPEKIDAEKAQAVSQLAH